jgi:hypothetical protein
LPTVPVQSVAHYCGRQRCTSALSDSLEPSGEPDVTESQYSNVRECSYIGTMRQPDALNRGRHLSGRTCCRRPHGRRRRHRECANIRRRSVRPSRENSLDHQHGKVGQLPLPTARVWSGVLNALLIPVCVLEGPFDAVCEVDQNREGIGWPIVSQKCSSPALDMANRVERVSFNAAGQVRHLFRAVCLAAAASSGVGRRQPAVCTGRSRCA